MRTLPLLLLLAVPLAGCLGDSDSSQSGPDPATPEGPGGEIPQVPADLMFVTQADTRATAGIWVEDGIAYLSGPEGLRIYDVSVPAEPVLLAEDIEETSSRDVDLLHHPNGRLYAVIARAGAGASLVDVTDPTAPALASNAGVSSHNIAVVPDSTIVYNSRSISLHVPGLGETGQVDIIDWSDPLDPKVTVFAFPAVAITVDGTPRPVLSTTCHDVTFDADRSLAFCAGVTDTTVWDVSDPADPVIIQVIDFPGTNIHHAVWTARNGTLLILGDEMAGVAAPTPTCSATVPYPTSALWFVDISDMANPVPFDYYQVPYDAVQAQGEGGVQAPYCSTHFGDVLQDRDLLVMGWYSAGTVLVDFSDVQMGATQAARTIAHYRPEGQVNTWEARFHGGHVFTGDTARGMDILQVTEENP